MAPKDALHFEGSASTSRRVCDSNDDDKDDDDVYDNDDDGGGGDDDGDGGGGGGDDDERLRFRRAIIEMNTQMSTTERNLCAKSKNSCGSRQTS